MVSILYLVERLAANVFAATYRLSINRLRSARAALILAYTSYYATMCILLALIAFAMMVAFSAILMICFPELYHRLVGMQWIPPIHHLHHLFMFGAVAWRGKTTCLRRVLEAFSPRRVWQEVRRTAEGNAVEAACLILSLMPNRIRVARIAYDLVYGATEAGLTLFLMAPLLLALLPLLCLLGVL
jgi:hypothetical protein